MRLSQIYLAKEAPLVRDNLDIQLAEDVQQAPRMDEHLGQEDILELREDHRVLDLDPKEQGGW